MSVPAIHALSSLPPNGSFRLPRTSRPYINFDRQLTFPKPMKRLLKFIFVLPTLLFAFTSCEETESTEDMQYANWQARNSSYFTETMNTAKNAIAAAKAQYGNDWEAHCDWRIYCSMYNDATQTGSPTDSIAVFIKERGTGSGCPLYTDTVRVNFMTRTIPNELGEDAESKNSASSSAILVLARMKPTYSVRSIACQTRWPSATTWRASPRRSNICTSETVGRCTSRASWATV